MKILNLLMFSLVLCCSTFATNIDTSIFVKSELKMQDLIDDILKSRELKERQEASLELERLMEETLKNNGSNDYSFGNLVGVSLQEPTDNTFRIFTWQLYIDKNHYLYKGFIQTKDGKVFRLEDKSPDMQTVQFSILKPENWYGALYYNILDFKYEGEQFYLLFGYDAIDFYNKRKLLEVLYFDKTGKPKFGKSVIEMQDSYARKLMVKRFLLEYSSSVNVTLNYDKDLDMIIYDHLIYGTPFKDSGPSNLPDGSYCGLKLSKEGIWKYIDKVHKDDPSKILVDATSYETIIGKSKGLSKKNQKDIFGRSK